MNKDIYLVLDGIKYAQNIGPVFRLADAFKIRKLFLCKNNTQRLNPNQQRILYKASRGATRWVEWEFTNSCINTIQELKNKGVNIIGVETGNDSKLINHFEFKFPIALVFGKEDDGISQEVLRLTDNLVKIPMHGNGKSLNVSTSVSIAVYEVIRALH